MRFEPFCIECRCEQAVHGCVGLALEFPKILGIEYVRYQFNGFRREFWTGGDRKFQHLYECQFEPSPQHGKLGPVELGTRGIGKVELRKLR
jgi:hypothetical protein